MTSNGQVMWDEPATYELGLRTRELVVSILDGIEWMDAVTGRWFENAAELIKHGGSLPSSVPLVSLGHVAEMTSALSAIGSAFVDFELAIAAAWGLVESDVRPTYEADMTDVLALVVPRRSGNIGEYSDVHFALMERFYSWRRAAAATGVQNLPGLSRYVDTVGSSSMRACSWLKWGMHAAAEVSREQGSS